MPEDFSTIQAAIDYGIDGDEIIVAPGVYYENLKMRGALIKLRGTDLWDWSVISRTVIDGGWAGSVITLAGTEWSPTNRPADMEISGFTIRHGSAFNGGGVDGRGGRAIISHCVVEANYAANLGGGIADVSGPVRYSKIINNVAGYAGGGVGRATSVRVCLIAGNRARLGGGIYWVGAAFSSTIAGNGAQEDGGGAYETPYFVYSVVWHNEAEGRGGDVFVQTTGWGTDYYPPGVVQLTRSVVSRDNSYWVGHNWDWIYQGITGPPSFEDPRFVNPEQGNYRLMRDSSALRMVKTWLDVPAVTMDLDFLPAARDAGCYEYRGLRSWHLEDRVSAFDVFRFALDWGYERDPMHPFRYTPDTDVNADGVVDAADL